MSALLRELARQTILDAQGTRTSIHIVANGCTDGTASVAQEGRSTIQAGGAALHVHDLAEGGKSRSWNRMVHEFAEPDLDYFVFADADIEFVTESVIAEMIQALENDPELRVCAGFPLKDASKRSDRTVVDQLSLAISAQTRHVDAISGQLYAARAEVLSRIWLPDETPGEDGFLNAMVNTNGFSEEPRSGLVKQHVRPTHYYESLGPIAFVRHETRLIVGTIINRWLFEYLWSLNLRSPAGESIRDWNAKQPDWVERIIRERVGTSSWLVPNAILFGRLKSNAQRSWWRRFAYLPLALGATLITIPPAIAANRRLKVIGAASMW